MSCFLPEINVHITFILLVSIDVSRPVTKQITSLTTLEMKGI